MSNVNPIMGRVKDKQTIVMHMAADRVMFLLHTSGSNVQSYPIRSLQHKITLTSCHLLEVLQEGDEYGVIASGFKFSKQSALTCIYMYSMVSQCL